jgi:hypothetical protein
MGDKDRSLFSTHAIRGVKKDLNQEFLAKQEGQKGQNG